MEMLDRYIKELMENSTPDAPAWNIEKIRGGKKANKWNYVDGCMIKALLEFYFLSGEKRYLEFADQFIDAFVDEDGSIRSYSVTEYNLDSVNAGKTLFELYDLTKKEKYKRAMNLIYTQLEGQPRTKSGSFWHKKIYPNQVWLDGLYMAQPFYLQYELSYNNGKNCADIFHQFQNVKQNMKNDRNGLSGYHRDFEQR